MKRMIVVMTSAVALGLSLAACTATGSSYQALDGKSGGYASQQVEANRYVVSYTGVKGMSKEQVAQFALLRAAELAQETGNEWFAVISTTTRRIDRNDISSALDANGHFLGVGAGFNAGGFGGGAPPSQVVERWKADEVAQTILIVQVGSGDSANFVGVQGTPEIFDAKSTIEEIRGS